MTRNKWPDNAWKYSSKYSRSTVPSGSSNPMRQGPTNVPRTEPLSGVGSLTLRLPLNPLGHGVLRGDSQTPCWSWIFVGERLWLRHTEAPMNICGDVHGLDAQLLESGFLVEGVLGCLAMYGYPSILVSSRLLQLRGILWIDDRQAYSSRPLRLLGFKYAPTLRRTSKREAFN